MANPEHLKILEQGVEVWNKWREENPDIWPDLRVADLSGKNLIAMNLSGANLSGANLSGVDLGIVDASEVDLRSDFVNVFILSGADLSERKLIAAELQGANLRKANLSKANLSGANLDMANLSEANLSEANLSDGHLAHVNLTGANLTGANLSEVGLYETILSNIDLSDVKHLDTCAHFGPCTIDHRTLQKSGRLPLEFLRGVGLPDNLIEFYPSLLCTEPVQFYSCFISYSSKNQEFAQCLYDSLQGKGVRCWFAPENLKIGDRIRDSIESVIRTKDKLLLILSKQSVNSAWVRKEVQDALKEEKRRKCTVLFPIRIDNAVMKTTEQWADDIHRTRHIGDFTKWKDHDAFQTSFKLLLRDLKQEENPPETESIP